MFSGISIWQLLILLAIVLLLFGTKKLRNLGGDLGGAFKGFKKAIKDDDEKLDSPADQAAVDSQLKETSDVQNTANTNSESK